MPTDVICNFDAVKQRVPGWVKDRNSMSCVAKMINHPSGSKISLFLWRHCQKHI